MDGDGGLDATADAPPRCYVDFPCFGRRWSCTDSTHYATMQSIDCRVICGHDNCSGAQCRAVGPPIACEAGTTCFQELVFSDGGSPCATEAPPNCPPVANDAGVLTVATHPPASACSPSELAIYRERCIDPATRSDTLCGIETSKKTPCVLCLGGSSAGIGLTRISGERNVPGCVALSGDAPCASALNDQYGCSERSCQQCGDADRARCAAIARATICPLTAGCAADGGAPGCTADSILTFFDTMAPLLCAP